jgi:hypothetical protein
VSATAEKEESDSIAEAVLNAIEAGLGAYDEGDGGAAIATLMGVQVGRAERAEHDKSLLRAMLSELLLATVGKGFDLAAGDVRDRAIKLLRETE